MPSAREVAEFIDENVAWTERVVRAWCTKRGIPRAAHDDLVQEAYIGLIAAARAFNPEMGVPFTAYAYTRVIGSAQDGTRRMDTISRRDREKVRKGTFVEPTFHSIDSSANEMIPLIERIAGAAEDDVDLTAIWQFVYRLPEKLRIVLYMRYVEDQTLEHIAAFFGVSTSRASQMHAKAIIRLGKMGGIRGQASEW